MSTAVRQKQQGPLVPKTEVFGRRIVSCGMPGLSTLNLASRSAPTITGGPTGVQRSRDLYGAQLQFHPSGGASGYTSIEYPSDNAGDNLSILWVGIPDNISTVNGELIHHGQDAAGNGWNITLKYFNSTALRGACVDSSPAEFTVDLTISGLSAGNHQRALLVKSGTTLSVYDWATRTSASGSAGNGGLRTSTIGPVLASDKEGFAAGHNRCNMWAVFSGALPTYAIWSILDNPWQIFETRKNVFYVSSSTSPTTAFTPAAAPSGLGSGSWTRASLPSGLGV